MKFKRGDIVRTKDGNLLSVVIEMFMLYKSSPKVHLKYIGPGATLSDGNGSFSPADVVALNDLQQKWYQYILDIDISKNLYTIEPNWR